MKSFDEENIINNRHAEMNLRESQMMLSLAMQSSRMGAWEIDVATGIVKWSEELEEIFGLEKGTFRQTREAFYELVYEDDRERVRREIYQSIEDRESYSVEFRVCHPDKSLRWIEGRGQAIYSNAGEPVRVYGLATEITERKLAEAALRESEERYRTLFDSIDEGFCIIELIFDAADTPIDYRFIQANPAMERLTGLKDAIGKTARSLVPDLEEFWFETYGKVALTGEAIRFENKSEPTNRWFDVHASRIGEANSRVAIVFNDITERKKYEEDLRASELRFRGLQQATPDGFMIFESVCDQNRKIVDFRWLYVNPAAENIVGKTEAALVGKNLLEIMPGNREEGLFDAYVSVVETGNMWQKEFQYRHENLDHFFMTTAVKVGDGFAVAFSNITERKRIELEREDLLEREKSARLEAEAANLAKDEFLSVLSHELRTPLNAILGWTRMMKSGLLDEIRTKQAVETIERNARLQNNLIEDLLDVSRIISGKMLIEETEVDFILVVHSAIETVQPLADVKNIKLDFSSDPENIKLFGDATRLQQIVVNLTNNAIKFTPEDGNVSLHLSKKHDNLVLEISDTGIGISKEFLPHIFDRFRQADSTTRRHHSGLGLGLTIVNHLTELHGGTVSAFSDGEGKGSVFTLTLPLKSSISNLLKDLSASSGSSKNDSANSFLKDRLILLVDDDCDGRFPVQVFLEKQGAKVFCAHSAREAMEKLEADTFDLLISDIGMPELDGYNLIKKIHDTEKNRTIPAIALTAYSSAEDRERALVSGYQHHLSKPVDFERLLQTIYSILTKNESE
jgi:PAS domain S-box-containing protein